MDKNFCLGVPWLTRKPIQAIVTTSLQAVLDRYQHGYILLHLSEFFERMTVEFTQKGIYTYECPCHEAY